MGYYVHPFGSYLHPSFPWHPAGPLGRMDPVHLFASSENHPFSVFSLAPQRLWRQSIYLMPLAFKSIYLMGIFPTLLSLAGVCQAMCFNSMLILYIRHHPCYQQPFAPTTQCSVSVRDFHPCAWNICSWYIVKIINSFQNCIYSISHFWGRKS